MGFVDKMKDFAGRLGGKKAKEDLSEFEVPVAAPVAKETPAEHPAEPAPEPAPEQSPEPHPKLPEISEPEPAPIQNPEQKFFETIDKFSLEDLRRRKADLEKMLKLADEELASGIISQAAYSEIRKNAGEKLREVSFELKAVERLLKRLGASGGRKKTKRKNAKKTGKRKAGRKAVSSARKKKSS
ncbi:MAG: hypothetical protein V1820_04445 [archaeon]